MALDLLDLDVQATSWSPTRDLRLQKERSLAEEYYDPKQIHRTPETVYSEKPNRKCSTGSPQVASTLTQRTLFLRSEHKTKKIAQRNSRCGCRGDVQSARFEVFDSQLRPER